MIFARRSFQAKISLDMISLLLVFGISLALVVSRLVSQAMIAENKKRGISNVLNMSARIENPLLALDLLQLQNIVDEAVRVDDDVAYAFVLDREGNPLVHTFS